MGGLHSVTAYAGSSFKLIRQLIIIWYWWGSLVVMILMQNIPWSSKLQTLELT